MKKLMATAGIFLFILTSSLTASAQSGMKEFSGDLITKASGQTMQAKFYSGKNKIRMEMPETIVINRMDKNVAWILMPSQNMYMEQAIDLKNLPKTSKDLEGELERVPMGKETVNGVSADKFKVTYTQGTDKVTVYQ